MSRDEIKAIAKAAAQEAVKETMDAMHSADGYVPAACPYNSETHHQEHEFIREAMQFVQRLNDMKWSTAKTVLAFLLTGALVLLFLGFKAKVGGA